MKKQILLLLLFSLFCVSIEAKQIHFICFADTNDPKIGQGVKQNVNLMTYFVMQLATGLSMENDIAPLIVMQGSDCNNKNLHSVIEGFQCSSDDIVIFSYLGHGTRSVDDKSEFPQMCLASHKESDFVPLEYVKDALVQKGPKFVLVLGDCCNSYSECVLPKENTLVSAGPTNISLTCAEALQTLFTDAQGYVISSGCKKGEYSWVNSVDGGFFTNGLLKGLDEYVSVSRPSYSWSTLLSGVSDWVVRYSRIALARQGNYVQTPIYRVNKTPNPKVNQKDSKKSVNDIRTALIAVCDEKVGYIERLNNCDQTIAEFFASDDAIVDIVGLDQETIVDHVTASDYLLRLSTVEHLANFNIVEQQKNNFGKITYLKIHEIYRGY